MRALAPHWLERLRTARLLVRAHLPQARRPALQRRADRHRRPRLRPRRLPALAASQALAFKAIRRLSPAYDLWRDFPYEYEIGKLAIDVINGWPLLREWVDDPAATPADLDALTAPDEQSWEEERRAYLLY